jgi:hypothetical protein
MIYSYIYLLQDGNDISTCIFKIGRTSVEDDSRRLPRLIHYNKGTIIHNLWIVPTHLVKSIESSIIEKFKVNFILHRGNEWFRGDSYGMKQEIDSIVHLYLTNPPKPTEIEESSESESSDTPSESPKQKWTYARRVQVNPAYREYNREQCKKRFQALKADTIRYEEYKRKKRKLRTQNDNNSP